MRKKGFSLLLAMLILLTGCSSGEPNGRQTTDPAPPTAGHENDKTPETPSAPLNPSSGLSQQQPMIGKTETPEDSEKAPQRPLEVDPSLAQLRQNIADEYALFGVAYLGYAELPTWSDVGVYIEANGFADAFPFLNAVMEDHAVLHEGGEIYAVVPLDDTVKLTVSNLMMDTSDDYIPDRGEDLLVVQDGSPLLLRGNISEIVPNLLIIGEKDDQKVEYTPCISGIDGLLVPQDGVYDFTCHHLLPPSSGVVVDPPSDAVYIGSWYGQQADAEGNLLALNLTLNANGRAEYTVGWPYSSIFERFEGQWRDDGGLRLTLDLHGGPVDDLGEPYANQQNTFSGTFIYEMPWYAMSLQHETGDPLIHGTEGATYTFINHNSYHLMGHWSNYVFSQGWEYILDLGADSSGRLTIRDNDGKELTVYEGWWIASENTLQISFLLQSGKHPENSELTFFYGEYEVEYLNPGEMNLRYLMGEIFNANMEEEGCAYLLAE